MSYGSREKKTRSVETPNLNDEEVMKVFKNMKAITPTSIAIQLNIKVSVAKMLSDLERQGEN